jgi:hypothetical protein
MAKGDPDHPDSGPVGFDIRTPADVKKAILLLGLAYLSAGSAVDPNAAKPATPSVANAPRSS